MSAFPSIYDWVREIKPELKKLDRIPLTGNAPPFPWDQLSARLAHSFACEGLTLSPGEISWRSKDQLLEGFGTTPFFLTFTIPSLKGEACWIVSEQEMALLAAWILAKESSHVNIHDNALIESFSKFFAVEVIYSLSQIDFDKTVIPAISRQTELPHKDSLCLDVSLSFQGQTLWSRLIISPELRTSWVDHFAKLEYPPSELTQHLAKIVDLAVHVEAGKVLLSMEEWSAVQLGDLLTLDSCSLKTDTLDGRVMLTINNKKAFRAKLKDGNLKILELPLFHEVETPMAKAPESGHEDEDEDDLSDLDLSEEEEDEDYGDDFDEDDDFFDEEEDELFEDEEEETETVEAPSQTDEEAIEKTEIEAELPTEEAVEEAPAQMVVEGPLTPGQIPVTLTVELGQIKMTMDQLLRLEPGNLLELDIHPKNGVDLTINGKLVGKGELLKIGEALGVRILELG